MKTWLALVMISLVTQTVRNVAHRTDLCGGENYVGYALTGIEKLVIPPGVVSGESVYVVANQEDWRERVEATRSADLSSLIKPQFPDDRVVLVGPTMHPISCASTTFAACTSFIALRLAEPPSQASATSGGCAFVLHLKGFEGRIVVLREINAK